MPRKYLAEMIMDRIADCKIYQGDKYPDGAPLAYLRKSVARDIMHPNTMRQLEYILTMLNDRGEKETFRYIKESVLGGKPFPWDE